MSVQHSLFEVKYSSEWGKFIIATKDIKIGQLILDEAPLLIGPLGIKGLNDEKADDDVFNSVEVCVCCLKLLFEEQHNSCRYCGFRICCEECQQEPFHRRYECELFQNNDISPHKEFNFGRLTLLRACLMYKDQDNLSNWQQFKALSSKLDIETDNFKAVLKKEILDATKWIREVCKLEVDSTTVGKILRTIIVNGFTMCHANNDLYTAEALYPTASFFSHSCSANSDWLIIPTDQMDIKHWNIRIYARRNISRNESITIAYTQDSLTMDTAARKKYLKKNFHFDCLCARCADKSEFKFYTSAMKCNVCGSAALLPDNQSDEMSLWTCRICEKCTDSLTIKGYVEVFESYLSSTMKNKLLGAEKEFRLEMLLTWSDTCNLTSNHRVVIRTLYFWLKTQNFRDLLEHSMESKRKFIKILQRAARCLKMFRMFGSLQSIVFLEWVFASAIATYYFKTETYSSIEYDDYSQKERKRIVYAVYSHMQIAIQIMQWNPTSELYSSFRETSFIQFKFWETEWETLKQVLIVDINDALTEDFKDAPSVEIEAVPTVVIQHVSSLVIKNIPTMDIKSVSIVDFQNVPSVELEAVPTVVIEHVTRVDIKDFSSVKIEGGPTVVVENVPTEDFNDASTVHMKNISTVEIKEVPKVDIEKVTRVDLEEVPKVDIEYAPLVDMKNISIVEIEEVPKVDIEEVTKVDIEEVTKVDIEEVTKVDMENTPMVDMKNVSTVETLEVPKIDIEYGPTVDIEDFSIVDILDYLTEDIIDHLTLDIENVSSLDFKHVTTLEIKAVPTAVVDHVPTKDLSKVEIKDFSKVEIKDFSKVEITDFSKVEIKDVSSMDIKDFSIVDIEDALALDFIDVPSVEIETVPTAVIEHFPTLDINYVTTLDLNDISAVNIEDVSTVDIQNLSAVYFKHFSTMETDSVATLVIEPVQTVVIKNGPTVNIEDISKVDLLDVPTIGIEAVPTVVINGVPSVIFNAIPTIVIDAVPTAVLKGDPTVAIDALPKDVAQIPEIHPSIMEQSDAATPSHEYEFIAIKPDVTLLSQYDFYFTN